MQYTISIVDDEDTIRDSLEIILAEEYTVQLYPDAETFLDAFEAHQPDLVLMDIGLPRMSGLQALVKIKEKNVHIPVVMITAYEDIQMVIDSMKNGAFDFILKPINPDILELTIKKALSTIALRKEVQLLQEKYLRDNQPCFIAESKKIQDIMDFIDMVSKSPDTPIMITGETGTGKELIARAIHARSPVFQGPFVAVNCSAFPADLIESELFGYEKGAFTGARQKGKKGFIEEAENGTLFLDEVADLSPAGQAKLLRFLEDGQFYKVGGTRIYRVRTRIVSATNRNLEAMIEKGTFRKDLFFRLCVVQATMPSLSERKKDIMPLARYFLMEFNAKFNKNILSISPSAQAALESHEFTGNIRELRNIVERAVLVAASDTLEQQDLGILSSPASNDRVDEIGEADIPDVFPTDIDLAKLLEDVEKKYMNKAFNFAEGNISLAAKMLNMNHHTFRYKWKKYSQ